MKRLPTCNLVPAACGLLLLAAPAACPGGPIITEGVARIYSYNDVAVRTTNNGEVYREGSFPVYDGIAVDTDNPGPGIFEYPSDSITQGTASSSVNGFRGGGVRWGLSEGQESGRLGGVVRGSTWAKAQATAGGKPIGASSQLNMRFTIENEVRFSERTRIKGVAAIRSHDGGHAAAVLPTIGTFSGPGARLFEAFTDVLRLDIHSFTNAGASRFWSDDQVLGTTLDREDSEAYIIWAVGELPGLAPDDALRPDPVRTEAEQFPNGVPDPLKGPNWGTRTVFTTPVADGYGLGEAMLYFDPLLATGYRFFVEGSRFASFLVPGALPNGDTEFQLVWDGITYELLAGQVFDFTAIDPAGAEWFDLIGLSLPYDPLASHAPFVSGFTFTTPGLATIYQAAHVSEESIDPSAVPEPGSLVLLATGGLGLVGSAIRKRRQQSRAVSVR